MLISPWMNQMVAIVFDSLASVIDSFAIAMTVDD
jgi:hypothetical protein